MFSTLLLVTMGAMMTMSSGGSSLRPGQDRAITVVATDYHFDIPKSITAGLTTFRLVNHGRELHQLYLVRLGEGKRAVDLVSAMKAGGPPPAWASDIGGPNGVDPGGTSLAATVMLQPGHYAALCIIPSADGTPHMQKGMAADFTVVAGARTASYPRAADLTIRLVDYGFSTGSPLTAGAHQVIVRNEGKQSHEMELARLAPGKTPSDVIAWIEKMQGPPPAHFIGGISPLAPGRQNELALVLQPGHYAMFCFIPDANDGKPHTAHGMIHDFEVR